MYLQFLALILVTHVYIIASKSLSCTPKYNNILPNKYVKAPDFFVADMYLVGFANPIVIDVNRSWSPNGVDHFYALLREGYYNCAAFYSIASSFSPLAARTGFAADHGYYDKWDFFIDEEDSSVLRYSNVKYTVMYDPSAGYGTRSTFISINLADNSYLDDLGYYSFAMVVDGFETLKAATSYDFPADKDFSDHDMDQMAAKGNDWLLDAYKNETVVLIEKITIQSSSSSSMPSSGSWAFSVLVIFFFSAAVVYASLYIYRRVRKEDYGTMLPNDSDHSDGVITLNLLNPTK
jgi:cyclophilin family peptidyl-prolyl cis-trans isomerase